MPRNIEVQTKNFELETSAQLIITTNPPSEFLWDSRQAVSHWPELAQNPTFLDQIKNHQVTFQNINVILNKLGPGKTLEQGLNNGTIHIPEAIGLLKSLKTVLEDKDNKRLILYLPMGLIPSADWSSKDNKLDQSIDDFKCIYLDVWKELLSVEDVRANFVDGDVIEADIRKQDPPRVVKAAHFIPELVKKGLINKNDILNLISDLDECVLKESINDVLPLMHELGQINDQELAQHSVVCNSNQKGLLTEIVSDKRGKWLTEKQKEIEISTQSETISEQILNNRPLEKSVKNEILIEGIRLAIENIIGINNQKANQIFEQYKEPLFSIWKTGDINTRHQLIKTFRHCYRLNFIDRQTINQMGISLPNLSGKFSENLQFLSSEIEKTKAVVQDIKIDSKLNKFVLPIILIGGSKVRGYDEANSDTDLYVFIKSGTPELMKHQIRENLKKKFLDSDLYDQPIEFWLEGENDLLRIKSLDNKDQLVADECWVNPIINSFWVGDKQKMDELFNKLVPSFFYKTNKVRYGHNLRELYFEDMERELLQYRLMHKGYENHFPLIKNYHKNIDLISGKSVFWDEGYRQLATRLFINNIFLPKL